MENKKKRNLKPVIIWAVLILLAPVVFKFLTGGIGRHDVEDISKKIEEHLYEKYGEEFVVDRIGLRNSRGQDFYQARIYPKSIIGTNKEWDDYYYASASVNKYSFGRLSGVGDGYGKVMMNISAEEYLMPKAKEIFGERVLLKTNIKYRKREKSGYFVQYLEENFKEQLEKVNNDPENNRLELDLQVYIFDRIENKEEKEVRRKEIFDFVQYLKEEGLFEYLEMRIVFVDERVLAPSYDEFEREIRRSNKVSKYIKEEDVRVELPPDELRNRMSRELQLEVDEMSEEKLLANMRKIKKSKLSYDGIRKWNSHYQALIYSKSMLKERYPTSLECNPDVLRDYKDIEDVRVGPNLEYIYVN